MMPRKNPYEPEMRLRSMKRVLETNTNLQHSNTTVASQTINLTFCGTQTAALGRRNNEGSQLKDTSGERVSPAEHSSSSTTGSKAGLSATAAQSLLLFSLLPTNVSYITE